MKKKEKIKGGKDRDFASPKENVSSLRSFVILTEDQISNKSLLNQYVGYSLLENWVKAVLKPNLKAFKNWKTKQSVRQKGFSRKI